jgi:hypothetical protein
VNDVTTYSCNISLYFYVFNVHSLELWMNGLVRMHWKGSVKKSHCWYAVKLAQYQYHCKRVPVYHTYTAPCDSLNLLKVGYEDTKRVSALQNVKQSRNRPGVAQKVPGGLGGSRRFRLPDFHDIQHMKVLSSSALRTGCLYHQECSWYSFSLGTESTPGPWCGRREICHWKIQWHHRESIPTVRLVAQHLNHYATPGPTFQYYNII